MSLRLRVYLRFEGGGLLFRQFLPEPPEYQLVFTLGGGRYQISLVLTDREHQLDSFTWDQVREDPDVVNRHQDLRCSGLTLTVLDSACPPDIVAALENGERSGATQRYGQEIYRVVLQVHQSICGYFRNVCKQFWVHEPAFDDRNWQNFLYGYNQTNWLASSGEWKPFQTEEHPTIHMVLRHYDYSASIDAWRNLSSFITGGREAPMRSVLIANSIEHLENNNGRLAIVESVTALETAIKRLLPRILHRAFASPELDVNVIDRVVEHAGLRAVSEMMVTSMRARLGITNDDIALTLKAIEERNNIVHNAQRRIEADLARRYVFAIDRLLEALVRQLA